MTEIRYPIYRGLQRPLTFRGFVGKYIAWGIASLITGIVLGGLIGALTKMIYGGLLTLIIISSGLLITFRSQKKGLHRKSRHRGIFIHPVNLKNTYVDSRQEFL